MIRQNVPLKDYSNYKIGGPAAYFLEVSTKEELLQGLREWQGISSSFPKDKKNIFVLGKGTNILISDKGFEGLIIHNSILGIERGGKDLTIGAGVLVSQILSYCIENQLSGFEWAGGLPGTIGGAVRGNAGAFSGETKDNVKEVTSLNLNTLSEKKRANLECLFDYRFSFFKSEQGKNEIILSVTLGLTNGDKETIRNSIQEKIDYRNAKHPMEYPNIGSTFKNVKVEAVPENWKKELTQYIKNDPFPVIPSAKLLFLANVKGKRIGDAQISEKHPNFIVNLGNAASNDVKALIVFARAAVLEKFGIELEEEIMYLGGD
ncbi:MAG: UDP-N-acetylmuramate dehydrogenase [Patescibacteria group bacterium]|nr:UDP-N-acetylmuramate dehydrogenase [Patescibacteria group bacterium]